MGAMKQDLLQRTREGGQALPDAAGSPYFEIECRLFSGIIPLARGRLCPSLEPRIYDKAVKMDQQELMRRIMEIQRDPNLTEAEKAKKRQEVMSGKWNQPAADDDKADEKKDAKGKAAKEADAGLDDDTLKCTICHDLCVRPVTAPCQHNFCLKCFQDLVGKGNKKECPNCRQKFGAAFAQNPRINTALTVAIRAFKAGAERPVSKPFERDPPWPSLQALPPLCPALPTQHQQRRPPRRGVYHRARRRIMVTIPNDHFGPIPPEADPRGTGIKVGEWWKDRLDCRQWGAHFPHVAGIAGQSNVGAQSVVLSGGYEDDRDEGEWFLYTGSGGRDLSGNKRTNKEQSSDQARAQGHCHAGLFENMNKALKLSCQKGLPVRVVRSFKEKRSSYAPSQETPVRYDGVYRIHKCWRTKGTQGFLVCRYLFVRCDNEPAPWSSEETGDRPLDEKDVPAAALEEMKRADKGQVYSMSANPWWGWDEEKSTWGWTHDPPVSQQRGGGGAAGPKAARKRLTEQEKALREFTCGLCKAVLSDPLSTPCGHNFCKPCLDKKYGGIADEVENAHRSLRVRKVLKPCPTCKVDICDFLKTAQVNRDMVAVIKKLQEAVEKARAEAAKEAAGGEGEGEDGGEDAAGEGAEGAEPMEAEAGAPPQQQQQQEQQREQGGAASHQVTDATDGSGGSTVGKDAAVVDHQAQTASPPKEPAPAPVAPAARPISEAAKREAAARALHSEFAEFDLDLVSALLEQEDGDEAAVKYALRKMRNQMAAEEKKRQKQAKLDAAKAEAKPLDASDAAEAVAPPKAVKGKRSRSATPAEGAAAKKAKA
eukprot:scaffold18.g1931.t1